LFLEIKSEDAVKMEVESQSQSEPKSVDELSPVQKAQQSTIEKMTKILSGEKSIFFHLQVSKSCFFNSKLLLNTTIGFILQLVYSIRTRTV